MALAISASSSSSAVLAASPSQQKTPLEKIDAGHLEHLSGLQMCLSSLFENSVSSLIISYLTFPSLINILRETEFRHSPEWRALECEPLISECMCVERSCLKKPLQEYFIDTLVRTKLDKTQPIFLESYGPGGGLRELLLILDLLNQGFKNVHFTFVEPAYAVSGREATILKISDSCFIAISSFIEEAILPYGEELSVRLYKDTRTVQEYLPSRSDPSQGAPDAIWMVDVSEEEERVNSLVAKHLAQKSQFQNTLVACTSIAHQHQAICTFAPFLYSALFIFKKQFNEPYALIYLENCQAKSRQI